MFILFLLLINIGFHHFQDSPLPLLINFLNIFLSTVVVCGHRFIYLLAVQSGYILQR